MEPSLPGNDLSDLGFVHASTPGSDHPLADLGFVPQHSGLEEFAHKAASYLPAAGGFGGGILGGMGGAAVGAPAGPAAIATGAAGAGVGAAMGGAAGKGLQHLIDTQLGYEKPIANASDLGDRLADMGKAGLDEGEGNAIGSSVAGVAMPVIRPIAKAIAGGAKSAAGTLAAKIIGGTPNEYRTAGIEKIGKMGQFLLDEGAVSPTSMSRKAVANRLPDLEQKTGQELSDSIKALDSTGEKVSKLDLAKRFDALSKAAARKGPGADAQAAKYAAARDRVLEDIQNNGPNMSFEGAEAWKQGYQEPINYAKVHKTAPEMGQIELAKASKLAVEDAAGNAASKFGGDLDANFLAAKERSGLAQTAVGMAEGAQGRASARNFVGPAAKAGPWLMAAGLLAHGNVGGAAVAAAAPPLVQFAKNRALGAGALGLRAASNTLMSVAKTEPWKLGPYAGILVNAMRNGGDDSFNANAYSLSQTDPGFQALAKQLGEQR